MTDAQLVAVCQVICARIKKNHPAELWAEYGPTPLAEQLRDSNPWSSAENCLFQVAWAVWSGAGSKLTVADLLTTLYGEHLAFVGSLLVAVGQGSEGVSRWLKAQGWSMHKNLVQLCAMFGGHRPSSSKPEFCGTCGVRLVSREEAPGGDPERVPTCSTCGCSLRWDMSYPQRGADGVPGAWVCVGCHELPGSCTCEPAPLDVGLPAVAREEVGHE